MKLYGILQKYDGRCSVLYSSEDRDDVVKTHIWFLAQQRYKEQGRQFSICVITEEEL